MEVDVGGAYGNSPEGRLLETGDIFLYSAEIGVGVGTGLPEVALTRAFGTFLY